ncbi:OmpA family protein [Hoylesella timonensis]|uniref:OmpA family protein n=1 Tax=Hoylesella timonensis TaxID=386414 RepID=UPI00336A9897
MQKKYYLAALAFLALPIMYADATPVVSVAPAADDTITVDRDELIDVLRRVATSEKRNQNRQMRNMRQQTRGRSYRQISPGQTIPVYNSSSRRVEYIPVYVPQVGRTQGFQPNMPTQNLQPNSSDAKESQEVKQLQEQIDQLQKQIEVLSQTVKDPTLRQQVESMAKQQNALRAKKDTIMMKAPVNNPTEQCCQEKTPVEPAHPVKVTPFDTNLRQVFFEISSNQLSKEAEHTLDAVVDVLKNNRNLKVELTGFSSKDGPKAFNKDLAMQRMNSVRSYLINHGVNTNQISALSYGIDKKSEMKTYARRVELCISL